MFAAIFPVVDGGLYRKGFFRTKLDGIKYIHDWTQIKTKLLSTTCCNTAANVLHEIRVPYQSDTDRRDIRKPCALTHLSNFCNDLGIHTPCCAEGHV